MAQHSETIPANCSLSNQKFSNLKTLLLGITVEMEITQGVWSVGVISRAFEEVLGYVRVQLLEVKTQSSFSNRGEGCMFDQVYFLPYRTISFSPSELITSLNNIILVALPPDMFLSSCFLIRLKSPKTSQSISLGIWTSFSQFKNNTLPSAVQGP